MSQPETNDVRERLQETAQMVAATLPPGTGFVVLAFDFGSDGRLEYISNAEREDVAQLMREFIENTETGYGTHAGALADVVAPPEIEQVYRKATLATGKSAASLRALAVTVFASILHHAVNKPGETIWTVTRIEAGKLSVEVDYPPRG